MDFKEFILAHDSDDLAALALARERYASDVQDFDLALSTLEVRRKLRVKVPEWYAEPSLRYPLRLSGEQCSSSETARYKASVASAFSGGGRLADLTGGLGVDSWAFSQVFSEVLYNEVQPLLADAARHIFAALQCGNVTVRCSELRPGRVAEVLDGFAPDIIFLDPARRAPDGRKVFRLEDCSPDVLQLLPELLEACPLLLLKLSPMADVSLVCRQLGCVREVHVVAAEGECKELLLLLQKGYSEPHSITIYENGACLPVPGGSVLSAGDSGDRGCGSYLFEPGKAMLKAGAFDLPCAYGLEKLEKHTHLYIGVVPDALKPFGKTFEILETLPLNKRTIREVAARYPQADVTARNIPLTSEDLRRKLGVKDGGSIHIFGAKAVAGNMLIICRVAQVTGA